jgi:Zn-finger in ubiquitin-hydrolases and other protein
MSLNQNSDPKTPNGCEECLQTGSDWVHLRLCLRCGHVGCCDSSPNKHATMETLPQEKTFCISQRGLKGSN